MKLFLQKKINTSTGVGIIIHTKINGEIRAIIPKLERTAYPPTAENNMEEINYSTKTLK